MNKPHEYESIEWMNMDQSIIDINIFLFPHLAIWVALVAWSIHVRQILKENCKFPKYDKFLLNPPSKQQPEH